MKINPELLYDVLYEDSSGSSGTITLSNSSANYNYLEIYFRTNDGSGNVGSQKIPNPDGKTTTLMYFYPATTSVVYGKVGLIHINGTSITRTRTVEITFNSSSLGVASLMSIYITKIIGYK